MILQRISTQSLGYSVIVTNPYFFDVAMGTIIVDYTDDAVYYIDALNPSNSLFILAANQIHVCNNLQINADYNVIGTIYSEGTDIYGSGDLFGSGDVV